MKTLVLNGSDVADFVKERQAHVVRGMKTPPKLVILRSGSTPVTDVYLRIKQNYGTEIGVQVEVVDSSAAKMATLIGDYNVRSDVDGIIVQLPLDDMSNVEELLNRVDPAKDVDGLHADSRFDPPTATAIQWLLAAYNVDLAGKRIVVVGQGRLVGAPLTRMFRASGYDVVAVDDTIKDIAPVCVEADILISATGVPGLITNNMVKPSAVVVDAGTASENGVVVGDVSEEVRQRTDISITPLRGGVGPLTVAALFDNLLRASS